MYSNLCFTAYYYIMINLVTNFEIYLIHVEMGLWFLLIYFVLISMYNI